MTILVFLCSDVDASQGLKFCKFSLWLLRLLIGRSWRSSPVRAEGPSPPAARLSMFRGGGGTAPVRQMSRLLWDVGAHRGRALAWGGPGAEPPAGGSGAGPVRAAEALDGLSFTIPAWHFSALGWAGLG